MSYSLSLTEPVIAGKGIGNIVLGLHITALFPVLKEAKFNDIKVTAFYPRLFCYTYKNSIALYFDILNGKLVRIDLMNEYQGKYEGKIGVGSAVKELKMIRNDISFDESYLLVGETYELILKLDTDEDIRSLDEVDSNKIKMITLEAFGWAKEST